MRKYKYETVSSILSAPQKYECWTISYFELDILKKKKMMMMMVRRRRRRSIMKQGDGQMESAPQIQSTKV